MFARKSERTADLRRMLHEVSHAVSEEAISAPRIAPYQLEASILLAKRVLELEDGYRAHSSPETIDHLIAEACSAAIRAVRLSSATLMTTHGIEKTSCATPVWHGPCCTSPAASSTM